MKDSEQRQPSEEQTEAVEKDGDEGFDRRDFFLKVGKWSAVIAGSYAAIAIFGACDDSEYDDDWIDYSRSSYSQYSESYADYCDGFCQDYTTSGNHCDYENAC